MATRQEGDFIELCRAPTAFATQLLVGRLRAEGLEARAEGEGLLADEFTLSAGGRAAGQIRIYVLESQLSDAKAVLADIAATRAALEAAESEAEADDAADADPD